MNICVFCASSESVPEKYREAVRELGTEMGRRGHNLVFGGYDSGLMGVAAHAVHDAGGKVYGVVPRSVTNFNARKVFDADFVHNVEDITTRMRLMCSLADAFVVAPGAFGTLEELFVALVDQKITPYEKKRIVLFNVDRYYEWFTDLCHRMVTEGLMSTSDLSLFSLESDSVGIIDALER